VGQSLELSQFRPSEPHLTLNGRNIPFVKHVKYISVIFNKRITRRLRTEMVEAKAFRRFVRIYSLFRSVHSSANIKLTFRKALIRTVMTEACPASELVTDTYLLKLQRMQNKVLCNIGNFPRCTWVHNLHTALSLPYVYCDEMPESQNRGVISQVTNCKSFHDNG
jgi:hypothetical protein